MKKNIYIKSDEEKLEELFLIVTSFSHPNQYYKKYIRLTIFIFWILWFSFHDERSWGVR